MIDLKGYEGFALIKGDSSVEANALSVFCLLNDIPVFRIDKETPCPSKYVPCGSVEWCEYVLGIQVKPDYYPEWLKQFLYREVWKTNSWPLQKVFIKPEDRYKRFSGFVTTGTYKKKKKPPFWCSGVVQFDNEWRYYVSYGEILCGEWYAGDEVHTPEAPKLEITIPKDYCGALDFGTLITGELALVEAQHPYACGWYGKDTKLFVKWLIDGWNYMRGF